MHVVLSSLHFISCRHTHPGFSFFHRKCHCVCVWLQGRDKGSCLPPLIIISKTNYEICLNYPPFPRLSKIIVKYNAFSFTTVIYTFKKNLQVFDYFPNFHLHYLKCYSLSYLCRVVIFLSLKHQKSWQDCVGFQSYFWIVIQVSWFQVVFTCFLVPGSCYFPDLSVFRTLEIALYAIKDIIKTLSQLGKYKEESAYKTRQDM